MIATEMDPPRDVTISGDELDPGEDPCSLSSFGTESVGGGVDAADGDVVPGGVVPAGGASMVGIGAVEEVDDVDVADVADAAAGAVLVDVAIPTCSVVVTGCTVEAVACGNDSIVDPLSVSLVVTSRRGCGWL